MDEKEALEFWFCEENGRITFFDCDGQRAKSNLCPEFPERIEA